MGFNYDPQYNYPDGFLTSTGSITTYNVRDYGAVGDGSTNDSTAFTNALNAAMDTLPARLFIPDGIYIIGSSLGNTNGKMQVPYISDVDTVTDTLTFNTNHTKRTGEGIVLRGTLPAGITADTLYYVNAPSATTMKLYNSEANAIAGGSTGLVDITGTIKTTGSLANGSTTLTVASALNAEVGTVALIAGASNVFSGFVITAISGTTLTTSVANAASSVTNVAVTFLGTIDITYMNLGLTIEGTGRSTLRKINSGFSGNGLLELVNTGNITVRNVNFEGTVFDKSAALINNDHLLYIGSAQKVLVDNCKFSNCGDHGLLIRTHPYDVFARSASDPRKGVNASEYVITNNYFYNVFYVGTNPTDLFHGGVKNCHFSRNTIENIRGAVRFTNRVPGGENIMITDNIINTSLDKGFDLDGISNLILERNIINDAATFGINLASAASSGVTGFAFQNIKLNRNTINRAGSAGIRIGLDSYLDGTVFDAKNIEIVGNQIIDMTNSTNVRAILWISGKPQGLRISQNTIQNFNGISAIDVQARVDTTGFSNDIIISDNNISGITNANCNIIYIARNSGSADQLRNILVRNNTISNSTALRCFYTDWVDGVKFVGNKIDVQNAVIYFGQDILTNASFENNDITTTGTGIILSASATISGVSIINNRLNVVGTGVIVGNVATQNVNIFGNDIIATTAAISAPLVPINTKAPGQLGRHEYSTTTPTVGTWRQGDRIEYTNATSSSSAIGQYCTLSGTLGTLSGVTGTINSGTNSLTVSSNTNLAIGAYITIAGVTGIKRITAMSGNTVTIDSNASASVTSAAIAYSPPTFIDVFPSGGSGGGGSSTPLTLKVNGSPIGSRFVLNVIGGTNVTAVGADDTANNELTLTLSAATSGGVSGVAVRKAGTLVATRPTLNINDGTGISTSIVDDAANNWINITINATGSSGSGGGSLLNVRDYGATGNGSTNDAAAIQSCLNDISAQGKAGIYFPNGVYVVGTAINLPTSARFPTITDYDNSTMRITFDSAHGLFNGDPCMLSSSNLPYNLEVAVTYYARVISTTVIELYNTRTNATNSASTTGRQALGVATVGSVDTGANTITFTANHNLETGWPVRFKTTGTLPGGIAAGTTYFVRVINNTTIAIHPIESSGALYPQQNAVANESVISLTSSGSGTHTLYILRGQIDRRLVRNGLIMEGSNRAQLVKPKVNEGASVNPTLMFYGIGFSHLGIYNLEFWGQQYDYTYNVFKFGDDGFRLGSCYNTLFDSCRFNYFGDGAIRYRTEFNDWTNDVNSFGLTVRNCRFHAFTQITSTVSNTGYHSSNMETQILNNTFERTRTGPKFASRKPGPNTIKIIGNTWKDCSLVHDSGGCLTIMSYTHVMVKDNHFYDCGNAPDSATTIGGWAINIMNNDGGTDVIGSPMHTYTVEGNYLDRVGRAINCRNEGYPDGYQNDFTDLIVRNNVIKNITKANSAGGFRGGAAINLFGNQYHRVQICDNQISNSPTPWGIRLTPVGGTFGSNDHNIIISNNTMQGMASDATLFNISGSSGTLNSVRITGTHGSSGSTFINAQNVADLSVDNCSYRVAGGTFINSSNIQYGKFTDNRVVCGTSGNTRGRGILVSSGSNFQLTGNYVEVTGEALGLPSGSASTVYDYANTWKGLVRVGNAHVYAGTIGGGRERYFVSGAPASGTSGNRTYEIGDEAVLQTPTAGGIYLWLCISAGTFASFSGGAPTATANATSATISVSSTTQIQVGDYIRFGASGAKVRVTSITSGTSLGLEASITVVSGDPISFVAPTFRAGITLAS